MRTCFSQIFLPESFTDKTETVITFLYVTYIAHIFLLFSYVGSFKLYLTLFTPKMNKRPSFGISFSSYEFSVHL